ASAAPGIRDCASSDAGELRRQGRVPAGPAALEAERRAAARRQRGVVGGGADGDRAPVDRDVAVPVAGDLVAGRQGEGHGPAVQRGAAGVGDLGLDHVPVVPLALGGGRDGAAARAAAGGGHGDGGRPRGTGPGRVPGVDGEGVRGGGRQAGDRGGRGGRGGHGRLAGALDPDHVVRGHAHVVGGRGPGQGRRGGGDRRGRRVAGGGGRLGVVAGRFVREPEPVREQRRLAVTVVDRLLREAPHPRHRQLAGRLDGAEQHVGD